MLRELMGLFGIIGDFSRFLRDSMRPSWDFLLFFLRILKSSVGEFVGGINWIGRNNLSIGWCHCDCEPSKRYWNAILVGSFWQPWRSAALGAAPQRPGEGEHGAGERQPQTGPRKQRPPQRDRPAQTSHRGSTVIPFQSISIHCKFIRRHNRSREKNDNDNNNNGLNPHFLLRIH